MLVLFDIDGTLLDDDGAVEAGLGAIHKVVAPISGQALVSDLKFVIRTTRAHDRRRALQLKLLQEATSAGAVTLSFTNPRDLDRWLGGS